MKEVSEVADQEMKMLKFVMKALKKMCRTVQEICFDLRLEMQKMLRFGMFLNDLLYKCSFINQLEQSQALFVQ